MKTEEERGKRKGKRCKGQNEDGRGRPGKKEKKPKRKGR